MLTFNLRALHRLECTGNGRVDCVQAQRPYSEGSGVPHRCGVGPVGRELQHQEKCAEEHGVVMQNGRESGRRSALLSSVPPAQRLWAPPAPQYGQVGPGALCCVWHCTSRFCSGA